ncbi:hypothetical protein [Xylanimonas cellulosilytica]|uniref:hypothetical protein n=1 Tax=Xylanimonas cellulosilytica TaxID=186189 RepID=UPI000302637C|nr:hypothetical protein [Xylanimonas cellulosilytica]
MVTTRAPEVSANAKDPSLYPVGTTAVVAIGALQSTHARGFGATVPELTGFQYKSTCKDPKCTVHSPLAQIQRAAKKQARTIKALGATARVLHDAIAEYGVDVTTLLLETFNPAAECGFPGHEDWTPQTWYAFTIGLDPDSQEHRWEQIGTGPAEALRSTLTTTAHDVADAVAQVVAAADAILEPALAPAEPTSDEVIQALEELVTGLRQQVESERAAHAATASRLAVVTGELEAARQTVRSVEGRHRTLTNEIAALMRRNRDLHRDLDAAVARAQAAEQATPVPVALAPAVVDGPDDVVPAPSPPDLPADVTTVAMALRAGRDLFPGLLITDHAIDQARRVDHDAKAAVWARRTWNALIDLDAFAHTPVAEEWSFHRYLSAQPAARTSAVHVAEGESDTVVDSYLAKQREFPVPTSVDPTGFAQVFAHVRIESGGKPPAPRLYYLDHRARSGRVVITYAGPHLPGARRG